MGIVGKILGCIYIILGFLAVIYGGLGIEITEQQRDQLQWFGVGLALGGLGLTLLLSSRDRR